MVIVFGCVMQQFGVMTMRWDDESREETGDMNSVILEVCWWSWRWYESKQKLMMMMMISADSDYSSYLPLMAYNGKTTNKLRLSLKIKKKLKCKEDLWFNLTRSDYFGQFLSLFHLFLDSCCCCVVVLWNCGTKGQQKGSLVSIWHLINVKVSFLNLMSSFAASRVCC